MVHVRYDGRSLDIPQSRLPLPRRVTDAEVIEAFQLLPRTEGIIPALECAHALAWMSRAREELAGKLVLMNLSGRGDKDVNQMMGILNL